MIEEEKFLELAEICDKIKILREVVKKDIILREVVKKDIMFRIYGHSQKTIMDFEHIANDVVDEVNRKAKQVIETAIIELDRRLSEYVNMK